MNAAPASPLTPVRPDFRRLDGSAPLWRVFGGLSDYADCLAEMDRLATRIAAGEAQEEVWLLEHPPVYTAGASAREEDLLSPRFPVHAVGRGGRYTYHGPGQRIAYVMLDLASRRRDVRLFVQSLEAWIIAALAEFGVAGYARQGRVGVWTPRPDKPQGLAGEPAEDKIAAIGVRLRRWTSFHGIALNVAPELSHYNGITPCGIAERHLGVTSLADLGRPAAIPDVDAALQKHFATIFGGPAD